ncbi:cupin domain-containing protein [Petrotoga halophila]|uniref:Cupin n=1 Tax=Petrotoga halophila DSM 16923 TaxID=1122953 RepID=A0A2S5EJD4_9BACT|nr:cupin domain-containing protein [Petrotoga halophila]POZ93246.1 cupin [Petrotoga halophila DSM 16923]
MDQKRAIIGKAKEVKPLIINNETTKDVEKRILIGKSNYGAPNFVMRLFTVKPGGYSPRHSHRWEHEIFIVKGKAEVYDGEKYNSVEAGSFIYVPGGIEHQLKNAGDEELEFICVIPTSADEE